MRWYIITIGEGRHWQGRDISPSPDSRNYFILNIEATKNRGIAPPPRIWKMAGDHPLEPYPGKIHGYALDYNLISHRKITVMKHETCCWHSARSIHQHRWLRWRHLDRHSPPHRTRPHIHWCSLSKKTWIIYSYWVVDWAIRTNNIGWWLLKGITGRAAEVLPKAQPRQYCYFVLGETYCTCATGRTGLALVK